jgi:hypothetical protein
VVDELIVAVELVPSGRVLTWRVPLGTARQVRLPCPLLLPDGTPVIAMNILVDHVWEAAPSPAATPLRGCAAASQ